MLSDRIQEVQQALLSAIESLHQARGILYVMLVEIQSADQIALEAILKMEEEIAKVDKLLPNAGHSTETS